MGTTPFLILLVLDIIQSGEGFNCYSCTYTLSADPSSNYECVTSPQNFTVGQITIPCSAPYMCVTKTLLNQDRAQIRSVTRSCLPQQEFCAGEKCCSYEGTYPTCEYKCRDDRCNDNNPEEHLGNNKISDGGGRGGASSVRLYGWLLFLTSTLCLLIVV